MATEQEKLEIRGMMDEWASAMGAADGPKLKSLWDHQYQNVVYIAEEQEHAIVGWAGINDYYDGLITGTSDRACSYDSLVSDVFEDTAIGQYGRSPRMEYVTRATFIYRRVAGLWKIIHYHESANPAIGLGGHVID